MTADEKTRRDTGSTRSDQIGKVFTVVGQDVRRCLVCEQLFTRRTASGHAQVVCTPGNVRNSETLNLCTSVHFPLMLTVSPTDRVLLLPEQE